MRTLINSVRILILSILMFGCARNEQSLTGNWWGLGNGEYVEVYFSDQTLYVCNTTSTYGYNIMQWNESSFSAKDILRDTAFFEYNLISPCHMKLIYNKDMTFDLYKTEIPIRTPFNTEKYLDSIIFDELGYWSLYRQQVFGYARDNNLLESLCE